MDVTFIEDKPYFTKTYLPGESKKIMEDGWWDSGQVLVQDFDSGQVVEHDSDYFLNYVLPSAIYNQSSNLYDHSTPFESEPV